MLTVTNVESIGSSSPILESGVNMGRVRDLIVTYVDETKALLQKSKKVVKGGEYDIKFPDPHDTAQVMTEFVTADQISVVLKENLRSAEKVLRMIDDGWDGMCIVCETEGVPFLRIAKYFSPICVTCQQALERSSRK